MMRCNYCGCEDISLKFMVERIGSYEKLFEENGWYDSYYCLKVKLDFDKIKFKGRSLFVHSCYKCDSCGNIQNKKKLEATNLKRCNNCRSSVGYIRDIIESNKADYIIKGKCANKKCGNEISTVCEAVDFDWDTYDKEPIEDHTLEKIMSGIGILVLFCLLITNGITTFPFITAVSVTFILMSGINILLKKIVS